MVRDAGADKFVYMLGSVAPRPQPHLSNQESACCCARPIRCKTAADCHAKGLSDLENSAKLKDKLLHEGLKDPLSPDIVDIVDMLQRPFSGVCSDLRYPDILLYGRC